MPLKNGRRLGGHRRCMPLLHRLGSEERSVPWTRPPRARLSPDPGLLDPTMIAIARTNSQFYRVNEL